LWRQVVRRGRRPGCRLRMFRHGLPSQSAPPNARARHRLTGNADRLRDHRHRHDQLRHRHLQVLRSTAPASTPPSATIVPPNARKPRPCVGRLAAVQRREDDAAQRAGNAPAITRRHRSERASPSSRCRLGTG
jgi:hypothetical protein